MLLLVSFAAGCATQPTWSRYEMYFGLSADSGRTQISDLQWKQFIDEEIISRFPDGFTVCQANGYWRGDATTYIEPSVILMLVAPETGDTEKKLESIAQAYALRFRQDAVLQTKSPVKVDLHRVAPTSAGDRPRAPPEE